MLGGLLFDEVRHAATDRVRLERYPTVMTGASAADTPELRVLRARLTCRTSEQHCGPRC